MAIFSSLMIRRALDRTSVAPAQSSTDDTSMFSRSLRAKAGLAPPVEMATVTGPLDTIEGAMNEHRGISSTAFSKMP